MLCRIYLNNCPFMVFFFLLPFLLNENVQISFKMLCDLKGTRVQRESKLI